MASIDPRNTMMTPAGPRSVARVEAEECAWRQVGGIDPMLPLTVDTVARMLADAYETGRTTRTRGELLERVARAHYGYVMGNIPQTTPYERIPQEDRKNVLEDIRVLLDQNVTEAGRPIDR